jgi:aquaporin related protein
MFLTVSFGGTHVANLTGGTVTTQSDTKFINTTKIIFISISFGFSLIINAWIFFRVSGALFNPAISLAMVLAKVITPLRGVLMSIAQVLGGITAAALIDRLMPGPLNIGTKLSGGISIAQGQIKL